MDLAPRRRLREDPGYESRFRVDTKDEHRSCPAPLGSRPIEADDPFGPMFESISELTERIKRSLEIRLRRGRPARRGLQRGPAPIGARLFHAQGRLGVNSRRHVEERHPAHGFRPDRRAGRSGARTADCVSAARGIPDRGPRDRARRNRGPRTGVPPALRQARPRRVVRPGPETAVATISRGGS